MKPAISKFVESLKAKDETLGILIFGSYARGDQRENSDADIFVLVKDGVWRDIETHDGQNFEMVYSSFDKAKSFYENNPNDAVQKWNDGKILFDKDGSMKKLKAFASAIKKKGKKPLDSKQIKHFKFDAEDRISAIKALRKTDITTANLYCQTLAQHLLELYFDLNQEWTPAPKQRLKHLRKTNSKLAKMFDNYYQSASFDTQFKKIEEIIASIFASKKKKK